MLREQKANLTGITANILKSHLVVSAVLSIVLRACACEQATGRQTENAEKRGEITGTPPVATATVVPRDAA